MSTLKTSSPARTINVRSRPHLAGRQVGKLSQRSPQSGRDPATLTQQEMLQLQHAVGNRAIDRLLSPTTLASLPQAASPVIQRATLVVNDIESGEDSAVLDDARAAHAGGVLYDMNHGEVVVDEDKEDDSHLDVFGHGHAGEIGMYGEAELVKEIVDLKDTLKLTELHSLTLHSCESAVPLDTSGEKEKLKLKYTGKEGTTLAERVNQEFFKRDQFVVTKGFEGLVFTDSDGETRVIKDPGKEEEYKTRRNAAMASAAQRDIENEYLHPASDKNVEYGRKEVLKTLGLTEEWEGELSHAELQAEWNKYVKWKDQEQDSFGEWDEEEEPEEGTFEYTHPHGQKPLKYDNKTSAAW
ncbi:hypothetical protein TFLX_03880 [Thermoflexales bacterium]|nr:hypothetical protein TFLX_03880 [Thermoflexales bacterium]